MKFIKITELKKQAKETRKNNNCIKNQAESLKLIANQNNQKDWQSLINESVLIIKDDKDDNKSKDGDFVFSASVIAWFGIRVSNVMTVLRNNTFIAKKDSLSYSKNVISGIHELAEQLHNIGGIFTENDPVRIRENVLEYKSFFASIDEMYTEVPVRGTDEYKNPLIHYKSWGMLFDLMLKELNEYNMENYTNTMKNTGI